VNIQKKILNHFLKKTLEDQLAIYKAEVQEEMTFPTPKYFIDCLNLRPCSEIFQRISEIIKKRSISYVQSFLGQNGIQIFVDILQNCSDDQIIAECLTCLNNLTKSIIALQNFLKLSNSIPIIVNCIGHLIPSTFEPALNLLLCILTNHPDSIKNIKILFNSIKRLKYSWQTFTFEMNDCKDRQFVTVLVTFLTKIMFLLEKKIKLQYEFSFEISTALIFEELEKLHYPKADQLYSSIQTLSDQILSHRQFVSSLFKFFIINPFNFKSLCRSIRKTIPQPQIFNSIALSIYYLISHFSNNSPYILNFIFNFLTAIRFCYMNKINNPFEKSSKIAINAKNLILPSFERIESSSEDKELWKRYFFLTDEHFSKFNSSDFQNDNSEEDDNVHKLQEAHEKEINALELQISQLQTQSKIFAKEKEELEKQLKSSQQENQTLLQNKSELEKQLKNDKALFENEKSQLKNEINNIQNSSQKQYEKLMKENTLFQESNKENQKKIESLSQEQTRFVQEKNEFEQLLSKTRNSLEQAEKEKHVVVHQLKDVQKSASDDQNQIQSLSNENSSLKDQIGKLKSEKYLLQNKIEELESESLSLKQLNNTNQSTDIQTEEFFSLSSKQSSSISSLSNSLEAT
jgi:hypothetical protein